MPRYSQRNPMSWPHVAEQRSRGNPDLLVLDHRKSACGMQDVSPSPLHKKHWMLTHELSYDEGSHNSDVTTCDEMSNSVSTTSRKPSMWASCWPVLTCIVQQGIGKDHHDVCQDQDWVCPGQMCSSTMTCTFEKHTRSFFSIILCLQCYFRNVLVLLCVLVLFLIK